MDNKKQTQDALLEAIDIMIENKLKKISFNYYVDGVIQSKNNNNTYDVLINNTLYKDIPSKNNFEYSVNDTVQILVKNGNWNKKFIDDKIGHDNVNTIDYIVEQKTEGIWTYEKRVSGIAECWGLWTITDCDISNPWGYLYESKTANYIEFPKNLFIDTPVCDMSVQESTMGVLSLEVSNSQTTKDRTCYIYPTRATPSVVTLTIAVRAKGRWK